MTDGKPIDMVLPRFSEYGRITWLADDDQAIFQSCGYNPKSTVSTYCDPLSLFLINISTNTYKLLIPNLYQVISPNPKGDLWVQWSKNEQVEIVSYIGFDTDHPAQTWILDINTGSVEEVKQ